MKQEPIMKTEVYVKPVKPYACVADNIGYGKIIKSEGTLSGDFRPGLRGYQIEETYTYEYLHEFEDPEFYVTRETSILGDGLFVNDTYFSVAGHPDFTVRAKITANSPNGNRYTLNLHMTCGNSILIEDHAMAFSGKPTDFDISKIRITYNKTRNASVHEFIHNMQTNINCGRIKVQSDMGEII